ncbi:HD domain-containing protein [Candidatus Berkelbacteria bacterium]|nr:HD domain-containing protein [Candidatus Berkelbacteria bacterium]
MGNETKIPTLARDVELLYEIGTLRHLDRVWKQFLGPETANCAEHLFRVAWIAFTIAKLEGAGDHEKILKLALLHDVAESRTGDVHYLSRQYTKRDDALATQDTFDGTIHEAEMLALAQEYESRQSIEAKIVKDADNIDVELELSELRKRGHSMGEIWIESRKKNVYPTLFTKTAQALWDQIVTADPHAWHLTSNRNRYVAGDWRKDSSS